MKKLFILFTFLLVYSCSDDNNEGNNQNQKGKLESITKNYYSNNSLYSTSTLSFFNDKLINIQNQDGSYEDYQYANGLVSRILNFDNTDTLFWTITYQYDSLGRIKEINRIPGENNDQIIPSARFEFTYEPTQIIVDVTFTPGNLNRYVFLLNENKQITQHNLIVSNGSVVDLNLFSYQYENGNSISVNSLNDSENYSKTFEYNELKNEFNYNQFLFGNEWKNNLLLNFFTFGFYLDIELVSTNLLSSSVFEVNNGVQNTNYAYSFNEFNQITREVLNQSSTFEPNFKSEVIYTYQ